MPRRFELLVFDWDGTLMDSAGAIVSALQSACADLALPVPSDEEARYIIGLGLNDAMSHILPDVDPDNYPRVVERYRFHYLQRDADTALFPGAVELVAALREAGFLLAVATGKGRRGLERVLESTGLKELFHASRCADEGHSKPDPGMLGALLEELAVTNNRALMIGDTTHDMEMARAAGVARVAAAYGAHPRNALLCYEPVACVDNLMELRQWLMQHA
ncbi:MAG: HAD-IA family hydrolase [Betaproteobacteria bacterium]|jgi:phosphoglycolate phosphatase|nr:MAG: HAD family hydrolase [Betaproteobacteria bacterium SG8_41]UCF74780.1 MAG: HAD-IA family hydrolase [Betaproteobacteria bacterium]